MLSITATIYLIATASLMLLPLPIPPSSYMSLLLPSLSPLAQPIHANPHFHLLRTKGNWFMLLRILGPNWSVSAWTKWPILVRPKLTCPTSLNNSDHLVRISPHIQSDQLVNGQRLDQQSQVVSNFNLCSSITRSLLLVMRLSLNPFSSILEHFVHLIFYLAILALCDT